MLQFVWVERLLAQGAPVAPPNPLGTTLPFFAMLFGIWYLLLIRPQRQKQKEHARMLKALKKHDDVVTSGGIHGTIMRLTDAEVILRVDEHAKLVVDRSAVQSVARKSLRVANEDPAPPEEHAS